MLFIISSHDGSKNSRVHTMSLSGFFVSSNVKSNFLTIRVKHTYKVELAKHLFCKISIHNLMAKDCDNFSSVIINSG